ncbi:MAG TPA: GNAT family N-acetyltransferase [Terracidiphilus sp.]|jgi:GNAT superfamily N-acetyltransferase|nr:GNAT family N-acetyltransferase [Terracidiphilus sp.]
MSPIPIRLCVEDDFEAIWEVINDGAQAYRGVIPPDRTHDPYMPKDHLRSEIADGVLFWACEKNDAIAAVMGIQYVGKVTLIRHAYVRTAFQREGLGGHMLAHLRAIARGPLLIGTWADAAWAIRFYQRHGFEIVSHKDKELLLRKYWKIPERQVETSVVLAEPGWAVPG